MPNNCPCGSSSSYDLCCAPLHAGKHTAGNPEQLMRSRYAAYVAKQVDYLLSTTHPRVRHLHTAEDIANWANANSWLQLEIVDTYENIVEFKAYFEHKGNPCVHHEISVFEKEKGIWYYVSGSFPKD